MLSPGQQILTRADFDSAMQLLVPVQVRQHGEIFDRGPIEIHNTDSVRIGGVRYLKAMCEFLVT